MTIENTRPAFGGHGERGITVLLRRMHDAVASEATIQERLDHLTRIIAAHIVADVCSIYLRLPSDDLELFSTEGLNREAVHLTRMKWGEGLVGVVAATQRPLVTADAPLHPAFSYRPETGEDPLHSFLGVPLIRSGKSLGVLVLQNRTSRRYTDEEVEAAQAVAILLAEIAASGELLDAATTSAVGAVLRGPQELTGAGLVPGVAIGRAAFHEPATPKHKVFAKDTGVEADRLEEGLASLRASVDELLARQTLGGASREVLETYRLFAYDRGWKERLRAAVFSGLTAEAAVEQVQAENRTRMAQAKDPYLRERMHDLDDLAWRLLRHLSGDAEANGRAIPEEAIVIARMMGPADLLEYDRDRLKGLVLAEASETSHVAIVARALGVPIVAGVDNALAIAEEGDAIVIDGETGAVHIRPKPEIIASYAEKSALLSEEQAALLKESQLPSVTRDGAVVEILMNAGIALDMGHLERTGAAGVGLFRTELQFLIGAQLPRVAAQERLYREILTLARDKPVVFRTADLGGDKSAGYMQRRAEANPAMGWRGLRMAIERPGLLRAQLRALLAAGVGRDLRLLFPMVTLASEMDVARELLEREIEFRRRRGHGLPERIEIGAMIETTAAAWRLNDIAKKVDFLSVGGNDLAQFYFAADRESEMTQRRYDPLDAGFLSFLKLIVKKAAASGTPLSFCGEHAADPLVAAALIGVGFRRISISASAVGRLRRLVRSVDAAVLGDWFAARIEITSGSLRAELAGMLAAEGAAVG